MAKKPRVGPRDRLISKMKFPLMLVVRASFAKSDPVPLVTKACEVLHDWFGDDVGNITLGNSVSRSVRERLLPYEGPKSAYCEFRVPPRALLESGAIAERGACSHGWFYHGSRKESSGCFDRWSVSYWPPREHRNRSEFFFDALLSDVPADGFRRIEPGLDAVFDVIAAQQPEYAWAELRPVEANWKGTGSSRTSYSNYRRSDWRAEAELAAWDELEEREAFVPGVNWRMLLSPVHAQALGGAFHLRQQMDQIRKNSPPARPFVRDLSHGYVDLCIDRCLRPEGRGPPTDAAFCVPNPSAATSLQAMLARNGMLMVQSPRYGAARVKPHEPPATPVAAVVIESDPAEYLARLRANPPRCIAAVAGAASTQEVRAMERQYGKLISVFRIAPGGEPAALSLWGRLNEFDHLDGPIAVGGPTRRAAAFFFDPAIDGYDGEVGQGRRRSKPLEQVHCSRCGHEKFRFVAAFQYSGENEELEDPKDIAHVEDFFSWFALRSKCDQCGKTKIIADVECA
jgi:hypothetical protein